MLLLSAAVALVTALPAWSLPQAKRVNARALSSAADISLTQEGIGAQLVGARNFNTSSLTFAKDGLHRYISETEAARMLAGKSATAASRSPHYLSSTVNVCGQVVYGGPNGNGLYSLPHTTGEELSFIGATDASINYGGYYDPQENALCGVYLNVSGSSIVGAYVVKFSCATGETIGMTQLSSETIGIAGYNAALDPTTGKVYGYYGVTGSCAWGTADYSTLQVTPIKSISYTDAMVYLACDETGQFYGIDPDLNLCKIDKLSGDVQVIGATGIPHQYIGGAMINAKDHTMIITYCTDTNGGMYEINLETGAGTHVCDFPTNTEVMNLWPGAALATEKAPVAPELTVTAPNGTLTAHYSLTVPDMLMDGTPVSGLVSWEIKVDGVKKFEGSNMANATIEGDITFDYDGYVEFAATATTPDGTSPVRKVRIFIGQGLPLAPTGVNISYADGKMKIKWDPVTGSEDGGYIDPSAITYAIIKDGSFVARDLTATSYEYDFEEPVTKTDIYYYVMAFNGNRPSEMTQSNTITLGALNTPYSIKFNSPSILTQNGFTVLDANGDRKKWTASSTYGVYYPYSNRNQADDWLFTPELNFEAGKVYRFSCDVYARPLNSHSPIETEKLEVKAGHGVTADAMTIEVIPVTEINNPKSEMRTLSGMIVPETTGRLNIGMHAVSDKYMNYLDIDCLSISEGMDPTAPQAAENLAVTPEPTGLHTAEITGTAPVKNVMENAIEGDVTLVISRGDEVITTLTAAPGAAFSYTDEVPEMGTYTYTVTPKVGDAVGVPASVSQYVGPATPEKVTWATVLESYQPGTVTVMWSPITKDVNGNEIPQSQISYSIMVWDEEGMHPLFDHNFTDTRATFKAIEDPEKQDFVEYFVLAYNREAPANAPIATEMIPVGKPYDMPVKYSNMNDLEKYLLGVRNYSGYIQWSMYGDESIEGITSADGDGQYFGCRASYIGVEADLYTGRINVIDGEHPELTFRVFKVSAEDANTYKVTIFVDGEEILLGTVDNKDLKEDKWNLVRFPLKDYVGKNVQLQISAVPQNMAFSFVDDIQIRETPSFDLSATALYAPVSATANKPFDIYAEVANTGFETARDFDVVLYRDGGEVETRHVSVLPADESMMVIFENVISLFDDPNDEANYTAEIEFAADNDFSNNLFEDVVVKRPVNELPTVTDLAGEATTEGVKLIWTSMIGVTPEPSEITETFENATSWAHTVPGWTMIDQDGSPVGGFQNIDIPGIEVGSTLASFFVFDATVGSEGTFNAASGQKFLTTMFRYDGGMNDDWAISPLLSGDAQTVSFYAASYQAAYPESLEFYTTTEDSVEPASFVKDESFGTTVLPQEWTQYTFELPEGTKHFAFRCVTRDGFMLMIDDVRYTPDPSVNAVTLLGYNVYRDGVQINKELVTAGEYLDTTAEEGAHTYYVTAVYAVGESELSNAVNVTAAASSGLATVDSEGVRVSVKGCEIIVTGAAEELVTIASVDGKVVYSAKGDARVAVAPAIYLTTVGTRTYKLFVK